MPLTYKKNVLAIVLFSESLKYGINPINIVCINRDLIY